MCKQKYRVFIFLFIAMAWLPTQAMELFQPPVKSAGGGGRDDLREQRPPTRPPRTQARPQVQMPDLPEPEPETADDLNASGYSGDAAISQGDLISPIKNAQCILSGRTMGCFMHPITHDHRYHFGLDMAAPAGTPIVAPADGCTKIEKIPEPPQYRGKKIGAGNVVILHCGAHRFRYLHLSRFASVSPPIKKGQVIGYVGSTGHSTGPHLHFETYKNGVIVNPLAVFPGRDKLCKQVKPPAKRYSDEMCHNGKAYKKHHHYDQPQQRRRRGARR